MKKLAIIGASAALAAMPVVGVFAVEPVTQEDTITITVPESCELAVTGTPADTTKTLSVGTYDDNITGSTFKVACNITTETWKLSAIGSSDETDKNVLKGASKGNIESTDNVADHLKVDSDTSDWGFKVAATGATVQGSYSNWSKIPGDDAQEIVSGSSVSGDQTVTITYGVAISATQDPDTYTGKVKYTLTQP